MARPKKQIDIETIKKLAHLHCTDEEIAAFVGVSVWTINRRYAQVIAECKGQSKAKLRRLLWQAAEKLNPAVLLRLAERYLDLDNVVVQKVQTLDDKPKVLKVTWLDDAEERTDTSDGKKDSTPEEDQPIKN